MFVKDQRMINTKSSLLYWNNRLLLYKETSNYIFNNANVTVQAQKKC